MYIMVDLDAALALTTCLNALTMLEIRLGRREETDLTRCQIKTTCVEENRTRLNFDRMLTVSAYGNK